MTWPLAFRMVYDVILERDLRNFGEGLERDGAAVATLFIEEKLVVDLWGGYADREANVVWKRNTRTVLFSATKAISALCIAILVDRGLLRYEDRLVEFWPEYGCYGKENTTVEDVLSHKAGLPYLNEEIDLLDVMDFELIRKKIERSRPIWAPGTASGYHAVTFGFLVDGIVRHVDEKQRNLKTFFLEEIAQPHGLSVDIGVRKEEAHCVARVTTPSFWEFLRDCIKNPKMIAMLGYGGQYVHVDPANQLVLAYLANGLKTGSGELCTTYMRLLRATYNALQGRRGGMGCHKMNVSHLHYWLGREHEAQIQLPSRGDTVAVNDPEVLALPMPAVTGVSSAPDLSRLFSLALDGTILSNGTLETISYPTLDSWHLEKVTLWPVRKGYGFFYERNPIVPVS
ncbi:beta-lactamase [Teladorsagia circumcincta]|uniref:Beta-lactamase n=1 Tax=Teladorsagia circumcincta TaxID=45464 RepID=A0A2G9UED7_TELCI|nr:beta-lactamase [Teladorsagia circumcincta]